MKRMKFLAISLVLLSSIIGVGTASAADGEIYVRPLKGTIDKWHLIETDPHIREFAREDLSDLRVLAVKNGDTIFAPHLLETRRPNQSSKVWDFEVINRSLTDSGLYVTLKIDEEAVINRLDINLSADNFEHRVKVEGSQDQNEWFMIKDDCRILGIKNAYTDYQFKKIHFPKSSYRYLRLFIEGDDPSFQSAGISYLEELEGSKVHYVTSDPKISIDDDKNTIIELDLKMEQPVGRVDLIVSTDIDHYRPIRIEYISDSAKTEKGLVYSYSKLYGGVLSSLEDRFFTFPQKRVKKIRITIVNHDNQPLDIDVAEVMGYSDALKVRFDQRADWRLVYGDHKMGRPNYDIGHFKDNVPEYMSSLTIGDPKVYAEEENILAPLIENELWLWVVLGIGVLLMGMFTVKMMKDRES